jgi:general secretion pathway protein L
MSSGRMFDDEELTLQDVVGIVLRNWRDELGQLAREKFASFGGQHRSQTVLHINASEILVCQTANGVSEDIAQLPRHDGNDRLHLGELSRVVARFELSKDVIVVLPQDSVLRPRLTMPYARRTALASALRYEIERLSPIEPTELYYDFATSGKPNAGMAELELRIVRKALVDESAQLCHGAGLEIAGFYFENDDRPVDWQSFPVDRYAVLRSLARRFGIAVLGCLAAILLIAFLLAAFARETSATNALADAVADAGMQAARVERLQQTIDRTTADLTLATRQKQSPLFIGVLAELTQIIPDNTWITELTMDGSKIRIQGASSAASDLIGLVDHSRQFSNAQFEAPLVHDATTKMDRFDLSFSVGGAKP